MAETSTGGSAVMPVPERLRIEPVEVAPPGRSAALVKTLNVLAALVFLLAVNALAGLRGFVSADEVVAHEQVEQLVEGSWTVPEDDPIIAGSRQLHPLEGISWAEDGYAPYAKHPAFPALLVPGERAAGRFGRFATVAIAAVAAAAALAGIAERRSRGWWGPAFWMFIAGTPLAFHGAALWAHSLGLAAVALTMGTFAASGAGQRVSWRSWLQLCIGVVAAGWLRSEATVFFVCVGGAAVVVGGLRRMRILSLVGASAASTAVVAFLAESVLRGSIVGESAAGTLSVPSTPLFDLGVRRFLVELWVFGFNGTLVSLLPFVGLVLLAAEGRRVVAADGNGGGLRPILLIAAVGCYAIGAMSGPVMSFVATAPLIVLGIIRMQKRDGFADVALLGSVLYFGAVVMTSYASAGGGDWGGRYLFLAVAPLGLVALPGLQALMVEHVRLVVTAAACSGVLLGAMVLDVVSLRAASSDLATELLADIEAASVLIGEERERIIVVTDPRVSRLLIEEELAGRVYLTKDAEILGDLLLALDDSDTPRPACLAFVDTLSPIPSVEVAGLESGQIEIFAIEAGKLTPPDVEGTGAAGSESVTTCR